MKEYILDLMCDEDKKWRECDKKYESVKGFIYYVWMESYGKLCGHLDEIDDRFYVELDGGNEIRLKNGKWMSVCLDNGDCSVWEEDDEEMIEYLNECVKEKFGE